MGRKKEGYKAPEGLVRQANSPNWYIKWKHLYKSTGTPDIEKARLIFIEVQKMVLTEELRAKEILGKSIPFSQMIQRYLKEISPQKRSWKSDHVNSKYPVKFFGEKKIDTITPQDIYKYQDWRKGQISERRKKPVSGATVNRELSLISDALTKAIRWGYIPTNPCREIERFSESRRDRYITNGEFENIKAVACQRKESAHLSDIMDTLYHTAQREGRILSLKWSQINLEARTITFPSSNKNKKTPEEIWINDKLFTVLLRIRRERSLMKVVGPYVFQKIDGSPYKSIQKTWVRSCQKAEVKDARIHDIRHKAITDMLNAGIPVSKVKTAVGHSQTQTTDGYTHLQVDATKEALESLAKRV